MTRITVWVNDSSGSVELMQLSDMPEDGSYEDQIAALSLLSVFDGYVCVSENYTGNVPEVGREHLRWDGTNVVAALPVPQSITPRQARLILLQMGMLQTVEEMITQQDEANRITWEYATEFRRDHPLLLAIAQNLQLDSAALDQLFIDAAAL